MRRRLLLQGLATTPWLLAGCPTKAAGLRFSGIPDGDKRALKEGYAAVARYLSDVLGRSVEPMHVPDYTAAVTALASGGIDFAWLGGVTLWIAITGVVYHLLLASPWEGLGLSGIADPCRPGRKPGRTLPGPQ